MGLALRYKQGCVCSGLSKGAQACSIFGLGKVVYFDSQRIGRESGGVRDYNWYGINGGTKQSGNGNSQRK